MKAHVSQAMLNYFQSELGCLRRSSNMCKLECSADLLSLSNAPKWRLKGTWLIHLVGRGHRSWEKEDWALRRVSFAPLCPEMGSKAPIKHLKISISENHKQFFYVFCALRVSTKFPLSSPSIGKNPFTLS